MPASLHLPASPPSSSLSMISLLDKIKQSKEDEKDKTTATESSLNSTTPKASKTQLTFLFPTTINTNTACSSSLNLSSTTSTSLNLTKSNLTAPKIFNFNNNKNSRFKSKLPIRSLASSIFSSSSSSSSSSASSSATIQVASSVKSNLINNSNNSSLSFLLNTNKNQSTFSPVTPIIGVSQNSPILSLNNNYNSKIVNIKRRKKRGAEFTNSSSSTDSSLSSLSSSSSSDSKASSSFSSKSIQKKKYQQTHRTAMIIDVFNKIYNGAATPINNSANQTSRPVNLSTETSSPINNSKSKFSFATSFLNISNEENNNEINSFKTTAGLRKSFNNFYLLNETNEKDKIYSAKYNINLFNSKSKPVKANLNYLPTVPSAHNISSAQDCPDLECCSINNDAILTLTSHTEDKARLEEVIKIHDFNEQVNAEGTDEEDKKDREFECGDVKSMSDSDATTLNELKAGCEEEENYYYELLANDERKACSYDLTDAKNSHQKEYFNKDEGQDTNHYEEIDKHEMPECQVDDDDMYSTLSEEENSINSASSFNSRSTPTSCSNSNSSTSRNDTGEIFMPKSKIDSDLKRPSIPTSTTEKLIVKKCLYKASKFAQKKRVKRIFLISTITNSKFNYFPNPKHNNKHGNNGDDKIKEPKRVSKNNNANSPLKASNKEIKENYEKLIEDECEEIADENQASGIELNARADDFYFEYDFDYDLNEQIKSSDEDFTLYSYNDLLNNNNNNNNNNVSTNVSNIKNDVDVNNAVNGNSSCVDEKDDEDDDVDNDEDGDEDDDDEVEEEENENCDNYDQNSFSDECLNEQDEIEQEEFEKLNKNLDKEKIINHKEKKFKLLDLIVHRLPGEQLGLNLNVANDDSRVLVTSIVPNSASNRASDSRGNICPIMLNDEILEINGVSLNNITNEEVLSIVQELPLYVALKLKRFDSVNRNRSYNSNKSEIKKKQKPKVVKVKFSTTGNHTSTTRMTLKPIIRQEPHGDSNLANIKIPYGYNLHTIYLSSLESKCIMPCDLKDCSEPNGLYKIDRNTLQIGEEDHLQKGDVLLNINGEELTFKNKFELISKLSSLGGIAEVNVLRKTLAHHSSSHLTSSNYCFASSKKSLSASNNNITATSNAISSNNNMNNLNSIANNLKTNSDQGPIIIPYHNGIFAQNSIKLAMRKYEKPAIKSTSDMESNTLNNTNTLTSTDNSNSNAGPIEALNVPSNTSCYHINTEVLNEAEEGECIQEKQKKNPEGEGDNAKEQQDDKNENQEEEENCLLSSIHSDNWLLLIDNVNTNTNTKCSVLQPEIPDISHQQTGSASSTTSSSPSMSNKIVNNLATAPNTLTSSSFHSERSLVKLNCPIFFDEPQNQSENKSHQDMFVSSLMSSYDGLDNQDELSKNMNKSSKYGSDCSTNDYLPSIKQYISTCQIEIKSCSPAQNATYQIKSKINVKNKPTPVFQTKPLNNNIEVDEEEDGLKSSLTSITTTNTGVNNAQATGGTDGGGGAALTTITVPFYSHAIANTNSNRKENSENDCDQDQLDDATLDLVDNNYYGIKELNKEEDKVEERTILNKLIDDLIKKVEIQILFDAKEDSAKDVVKTQSDKIENILNPVNKIDDNQKTINQQSISNDFNKKNNELQNQLNLAIQSFKSTSSLSRIVNKPKTLPKETTKTESSSVSSEYNLDSLKRSVHEELVNLIKNGVLLNNTTNTNNKSFTLGSKCSNRLSKTLLRLHNRRYDEDQNNKEHENEVKKNHGSKSLPPNMVVFQEDNISPILTSPLPIPLPAPKISSSSSSISSSNLSKSSTATIVHKPNEDAALDFLNNKRFCLFNSHRIKSATITSTKKIVLMNNEINRGSCPRTQIKSNDEQDKLVKKTADQTQKRQQKSLIRGGFNTLKHSVSFNLKYIESSSIDYVDSAFDKQSKYNKTTASTLNTSPPPHIPFLVVPKSKNIQAELNGKNNNINGTSNKSDNKLDSEIGVSCKSNEITFSASETTASGTGLVTNSMKIAKAFEPELNKLKSQQQEQKITNIMKIRNINENTNSSVKEKIMLFSNVASGSNKPPVLAKTSNTRPLSQVITNLNKPSQQSNQNLLKNQNSQFSSSCQSIFKNTPNSTLSSPCNRVDTSTKNINQNLKLNSTSSLSTNVSLSKKVEGSTTTLTSVETISLANQGSLNRPALTSSHSNHNTKSIEKKNSFKSVKDKIAYFSSNQKVNLQNKSGIGNKNKSISKSIEIISSQVQNAINIKKTRPKEWDSLKHAYNSSNNEDSNELVKKPENSKFPSYALSKKNNSTVIDYVSPSSNKSIKQSNMKNQSTTNAKTDSKCCTHNDNENKISNLIENLETKMKHG